MPKIKEFRNLNLRKIDRGLSQLKKFKWHRINQDLSFTSLNRIIETEFKNCGLFIPTIISHHSSCVHGGIFPYKIYRVSALNSKMLESDINSYIYPPRESTKMGRANIKNYPVLYGSTSPFTALSEKIFTKNSTDQDVYYISEWEFTQPVSHSVFSQKIVQFLENKIYGIKELNVEQQKGLIQLQQFINDSFLSKDYTALSAYIAHRQLYSYLEMQDEFIYQKLYNDLIIYESLQMANIESFNVAVHPNAVRDKMKLNKVFKIKIKWFNKSLSKANLKLLDYGDCKDGNIYFIYKTCGSYGEVYYQDYLNTLEKFSRSSPFVQMDKIKLQNFKERIAL